AVRQAGRGAAAARHHRRDRAGARGRGCVRRLRSSRGARGHPAPLPRLTGATARGICLGPAAEGWSGPVMDSETPRPTGPGHPAAATPTRPAIPVPGTHAPGADAPGPTTPRPGPRDRPRGPALGVVPQLRAAGSSLLAGVLGALSGLLGCDALGLGVLTGLLGTLGGLGRRGVLGGSGLLRGGGLVGPGGVLGGALGLLHHSLLRGVLLLDQLDDGHRGVVAL